MREVPEIEADWTCCVDCEAFYESLLVADGYDPEAEAKQHAEKRKRIDAEMEAKRQREIEQIYLDNTKPSQRMQ